MLKSNKTPLITKLYFLFWFLYFLLFWSKALFYDASGNLVAGHVNIWGDWAAHFTMGTFMENHGFLTHQSPFLIDSQFSYPFVSDLLSSISYAISGNLVSSFIVPSFLLSLFFVWAVYYFFFTLWRSHYKTILNSLIFILNGGLGFYFYFQETIAKNKLIESILNPFHEVTRFDDQYIKWINIIDSMVIPQRAFLLGFPLTLLALTFIYQNYFTKNTFSHKKNILAGIIFGLMPIIHTHSFLASFIILSFWAFGNILTQSRIDLKMIEKSSLNLTIVRRWLEVLLITSVLAIPLIGLYFIGNVTEGFSTFFPGWLARSYQINWFEFWFRNWFLNPWLGILGFFVLSTQKRKSIFIFAPFILIFILSNLFTFQPFPWDNTKLLVWASLGISFLTMSVLEKIYTKKSILNKTIAALIFLFSILSGVMDLHYIVRHDLHSHIMYTKEELTLSNWVKESTPSDAVWLTGDKHNHFVFNLTGRRTILTYRGWLWTHGYDYLPIERDVRNMYQHPNQNKHLMDKYRISYIIVGNNEKSVWKANEQEFMQNFNLIKQTKNYKIFEKK